MRSQATIAFLDNVVNQILKSFDAVHDLFPDSHIFAHERELFEFMETHHTDLVLMNLDLTPNDAIHLLREIRNRQSPAPFIVIYTVKQDDFAQEMALNTGADSYIGFHRKPQVLRLFVRNLLQRRVSVPAFRPGKEVVIDHESYLIYKDGVPVQLPRKEFLLFRLLYSNSEKFFSKAEIAGEIWKDEQIARKRTIDVHIYNIRQFFGKRIIQSQKGKGYRINKKFIDL